jgi:hypothetical protein
MTALPSASAGATARTDRICGKFHGLITPTTPTGTRRAIDSRPGSLLRQQMSPGLRRQRGGFPQLAEDELDLEGRLPGDGATLAYQPGLKLLVVIFQNAGHPPDQRRALRAGLSRPLRLGRPGLPGSLGDIALVRQAELSQDLAGRRLDGPERASLCRRPATAENLGAPVGPVEQRHCIVLSPVRIYRRTARPAAFRCAARSCSPGHEHAGRWHQDLYPGQSGPGATSLTSFRTSGSTHDHSRTPVGTL